MLVEDALFATLDPTVRRAQHADGRDFTLTDTVGFVRHLPHQLVEAFRSTLEEVADADLILHVVDGSDADPEEQLAAVREVLAEIGAQHVPEIIVINKADAADPLVLAPAAAPRAALDRGAARRPARASPSCSRLIEDDLPHATVAIDLVVPYDRGDLVARAHREGELDTRGAPRDRHPPRRPGQRAARRRPAVRPPPDAYSHRRARHAPGLRPAEATVRRATTWAESRIVGVLRLASWNVLAPSYAHQSRYAGVSPDDLAAAARVPRVRARILGLLADSRRRGAAGGRRRPRVLAARRGRCERGARAATLVRATACCSPPRRHVLAGPTGVTDGRAAHLGGGHGRRRRSSCRCTSTRRSRSAGCTASPRPASSSPGATSRPAPIVVLLGDINGAWDSPHGRGAAPRGFRVGAVRGDRSDERPDPRAST